MNHRAIAAHLLVTLTATGPTLLVAGEPETGVLIGATEMRKDGHAAGY